MADILDTDPQSNDFFFITDFDGIFGAGKNSFVVNPSKRILPNSNVSVKVYTSKNIELFTQPAKAKDAKYGDSTTFGTTYYTKVPEGTVSDFGFIEISAQGVDLGNYTGSFEYYKNIPYKVSNDQSSPLLQAPSTAPLPTGSVIWRRQISIDTIFPTKSQVRFFDYPQLSVTPILHKVPEYPTQSFAIASGAFYSNAVTPPRNSNGDFDVEGSEIVYQIYRQSGTAFSSAMEGENIRIKDINVLKFVYSSQENNEIEYNGPLNTDFIAKVKRVVNENSLIISIPFATVSDLIGRTNENSQYAKNDLTNIRDYVSENDPNKQNGYFKKNFYVLSISSGNFEIIYKNIPFNLPRSYDSGSIETIRAYAHVEVRNIRTLCGKVSSYKIYGRSLNTPQSKTLLVEGKIESQECIKTTEFDNAFYGKQGEFYSQTYANKYWLKNGSFTFNQSNDVLINGVNISHASNEAKTDYVIFKDNVAEPSRTSAYISPTLLSNSYWYGNTEVFNSKLPYPTASYNVPALLSAYGSSQENLLAGSVHNSNPIKLVENSLYQFSMRVRAQSANTDSSQLYIYFLSGEEITQIGYIDNAYNFGANELYTSSFFVPNTKFGTIKIVPVAGNWNLSQVSIKPYSSIGYSPDVFVANVPISNTIKNELFEIEVELYDRSGNLAYGEDSYNFKYNKTYLPLNKKFFVDIDGISI